MQYSYKFKCHLSLFRVMWHTGSYTRTSTSFFCEQCCILLNNETFCHIMIHSFKDLPEIQ